MQHLSFSFSQPHREAHAHVFPLVMRKLRLRGVKSLVQGHTGCLEYEHLLFYSRAGNQASTLLVPAPLPTAERAGKAGPLQAPPSSALREGLHFNGELNCFPQRALCLIKVDFEFDSVSAVQTPLAGSWRGKD